MEPVAHATSPALRLPGERGTTILELLVVLVVLGTLAGMLVTSVGKAADMNPHAGTLASFTAMRVAVLGRVGPGPPSGYLADMGALPRQVRDLFMPPAGASPFSPATGFGWRGPYLATSTGAYEPDPLDGFTTVYGNLHDPIVLDGWSAPIVLQIPDPDGDELLTEDDLRHARLVSAGPDRRLDTPSTDAGSAAPGNAWFPAQSQCGDDLLLYLRVADLRPE